MTAMVIGGSGFLGTELVRQATAEGRDVVVKTDRPGWQVVSDSATEDEEDGS